MKLRPQQLYPWLAALIDGEGSIMLNKRTFNEHQRKIKRRNVHYRAVVTIATTDYRLMTALIKNTGVRRVYRHRVNGDPRVLMKRSQYTWRLANEDIRLWLPRVIPYLVLKYKQAKLLLEALKIKIQITPGNPGFLPVNRGRLVNRLHKIYSEIRALNQKGRILEVV